MYKVFQEDQTADQYEYVPKGFRVFSDLASDEDAENSVERMKKRECCSPDKRSPTNRSGQGDRNHDTAITEQGEGIKNKNREQRQGGHSWASLGC
jgi:hypothetical protein